MKALFLQIILLTALLTAIQGADRYWIANAESMWDNTANWSTSSGGSGGATVPDSGDEAIFDDNGIGNCILDADINVRGIEVEIGYNGTIRQSNHVITVGDKDFIISGGSFVGGTVNMVINSDFQLDGGVFTSTSTALSIKGDYDFNGGTFIHNAGEVLFNGTGNSYFNISSPAPKFYNVTIDLTDDKKLQFGNTDSLIVLNDLDILDGKVDKGYMVVEGDVNIYDDFDGGSAALIFSGPHLQSLDMNGTPGNFDGDVYLDKSTANSIVLLTAFTLDENNQDLTMNKGYIVSDTVNLFAMDSRNTWTGASDSSFVHGPIMKIGNDAFQFPTGKYGVYAPITMSAPSNHNHSFRAEYFNQNPGQVYDLNSKEATLDRVSMCEYWNLDRISGTSEVEVSLSWNSPRSCGVDVLCDLAVAHWDGTTWTDLGNGGTTGTPHMGEVVTGFACNSPARVTEFSPFTLASRTANNPLPVELIDFDAELVNDQVEITWNTAAEINNNYFTVERSLDGINWTDIVTVSGAGTTSTPQDYHSIDYSPATGINYYRLKQVDYDNTIEYSDVVSVNVEKTVQSLKNELIIYPNPTRDLTRVRSSADDLSETSVFNMIGRQFFPNANTIGNEVELDLSTLPPGMYVVKSGESSGMVYKY